MQNMKVYNVEGQTKEMEWMPEWAAVTYNHELEVLDMLLHIVRGNVFVDVGCFIGGFTKIMAYIARKRNGKVHSIDLFKLENQSALGYIHKDHNVKEIFTRHMKERGLLEYINVIEGVSWEVSSRFEDNSVDFIFIDADHRYQSVKKDIESWYPKLKVGGIMAGHDYEFEEYDEKFIDVDGDGDRHHGVIKAVNEFFLDNNRSLIEGNPYNTIWFHQKC